MINQLWLKTFCTLADIGHFTQTAEKLYMTQSGVSQHIKKLEKQLNCQLLIRAGKSFSLSNQGKQLHQKGRELLRSSEELEASIKQDNAYIGNVKIASPGSVGLKLYSHLLDLQQNHRKLVIDYAFAPNKSIESDLVERKLDLGLITELTNTSNLLSEKVAEEPLVLVTSNKINSISWPLMLELGFISHPDAAHHGRQLLSQNFSQFEHIEQFTHRGFSNQISLILELTNSVSESLYLCVNRHSILPNRVKLVKSLVTDYLR